MKAFGATSGRESSLQFESLSAMFPKNMALKMGLRDARMARCAATGVFSLPTSRVISVVSVS